MHRLSLELAVVAGMAALTVVVHMLGLNGLMRLARLHVKHLRTPWLAVDRLLAPLLMVMGLCVLHGLEVGAYAGLFRGLGAARDWEEALYLSAGSYSTAGWQGVATPRAWRVVAAFESLNGMLLMGWSTAFLFQSLHRMLETEENHPLPEGALAKEIEAEVEEKVEEVVAAEIQDGADTAAEGLATPSPRPSRSGRGAP